MMWSEPSPLVWFTWTVWSVPQKESKRLPSHISWSVQNQKWFCDWRRGVVNVLTSIKCVRWLENAGLENGGGSRRTGHAGLDIDGRGRRGGPFVGRHLSVRQCPVHHCPVLHFASVNVVSVIFQSVIVQPGIVNPCDLVRQCPVLQCPPLRLRPSFSSTELSSPGISAIPVSHTCDLYDVNRWCWSAWWSCFSSVKCLKRCNISTSSTLARDAQWR